jgi:hypothetical protein
LDSFSGKDLDFFWKGVSTSLNLNFPPSFFPFSNFVVDMEIENEYLQRKNCLFCMLPFGLPFLETKAQQASEEDSDQMSISYACSPSMSASSSTKVVRFTHFQAASSTPYGEVLFLPNIYNPLIANTQSPTTEANFYAPLENIFNAFFKLLNLPYVCEKQALLKNKGIIDKSVDKGIVDLAIYKTTNHKKREMLLVEVKRNLREGRDQLIDYSTILLNSDKERFMVLSMLCDFNEFVFFCTFRFNGSVAFVQISDYDSFSFGSNGLGLLKLLYVLELPWPIYGSIIVSNRSTNTLQVWLQKKYLGSGSSSEVYEYVDGENESKVVKFFRTDCYSEFCKEVEIYKILNKHNNSLKMLWYNSGRLIICIDKVRKNVEISEVSDRGIESIYNCLKKFHEQTEHVHQDIYHRNILQIDKDTLVLNDYGLAV